MYDKSIYDVSVISANYNNGRYLDAFLNSINSSSVHPREVIIVDDGSTDNSLEILSKRDEFYLKVIPVKKNVGFANALNLAISESRSKYLLRVDPDDILHRDRIKIQFEYLENNPEVDLLGSNVGYFKEEISSIIGVSNFPVRSIEIRKRYLRGEHGLLHGSIMGRRRLFLETKYRQEFVPAEDYDLFGRMISKGAVGANIEEVLTFVRIHANSVSNFLPYSTIEKTYKLRDSIFNTKTPKLIVYINFLSMKYYRKYYFESSNLKKFFYLFLASLFRPDKAVRKIF